MPNELFTIHLAFSFRAWWIRCMLCGGVRAHHIHVADTYRRVQHPIPLSLACVFCKQMKSIIFAAFPISLPAQQLLVPQMEMLSLSFSIFSQSQGGECVDMYHGRSSFLWNFLFGTHFSLNRNRTENINFSKWILAKLWSCFCYLRWQPAFAVSLHITHLLRLRGHFASSLFIFNRCEFVQLVSRVPKRTQMQSDCMTIC